MSTETTNKKIKIDNGTTFGRTYTDKAVDELLKNVGGGGISVIELTDKNGTIASAQLGKINANPQNFAFKYSGKILLFTSAGSTTYQYCNNNTTSSDNNVMTTSTLLTIESSTGVYTITENAHNVAANSIHPVNGGDLTNIQVGSKVYSIPSGGGDIWLDITPYLNDATMTISQEGYNFLYNGIMKNDKYCGITVGEKHCLYYLEYVGNLFFEYKEAEKNAKSYLFGIYKDLHVTYIENPFIKNIPDLPSDASTKNLTLNSVNGTLTWNTIGDGLLIENGVLKTINVGGGGNIPTLPNDASTKTYTLKAINGVLTWIEG